MNIVELPAPAPTLPDNPFEAPPSSGDGGGFSAPNYLDNEDSTYQDTFKNPPTTPTNYDLPPVQIGDGGGSSDKSPAGNENAPPVDWSKVPTVDFTNNSVDSKPPGQPTTNDINLKPSDYDSASGYGQSPWAGYNNPWAGNEAVNLANIADGTIDLSDKIQPLNPSDNGHAGGSSIWADYSQWTDSQFGSPDSTFNTLVGRDPNAGHQNNWFEEAVGGVKNFFEDLVAGAKNVWERIFPDDGVRQTVEGLVMASPLGPIVNGVKGGIEIVETVWTGVERAVTGFCDWLGSLFR